MAERLDKIILKGPFQCKLFYDFMFCRKETEMEVNYQTYLLKETNDNTHKKYNKK